VPRSEKIQQEIIQIVAEIAELSVDQVSPVAMLQDLGIDSLNGLRIVAEVEKRYGIQIPDDAVGRIRSMQDIFTMVDAYETEG
jgi:acyl carrier protein